jgi:hypothetical protein
MPRPSIQNALAGVIGFLLLVLVVLEIQRMNNAADCDHASVVTQPTR